MNIRPRLFWGSFVSEGSKMSNKTKPPSHYETLDVNHRATQSEIKAAYFKLSKEYHPDKNSSEAATAKFRDIAEAYEVLGNFDSRKSYDRSILTHTRYQGPQHSDRQEDTKMKYYRSQAALFRDSQKSGSTPVYDFDAWTKAHYGQTLDRMFKDRAYSSKRRLLKENVGFSKGNLAHMELMWVGISIIIAGMLISWRCTNYDDPSLFVQNRDALNKSTSSDTDRAQVKVPTESLVTK